MCILAPSMKDVILNIFYGYAEAHDITYNTNKYVCTHIKCIKFKRLAVSSVYLGDNILQYVFKYKFLGYNISDTRDDDDIKITITGIYARSHKLIQKFNIFLDM